MARRTGSQPILQDSKKVSGSGKSLLADAINTIVTGQHMGRTSWPAGNEEEVRKKITSILDAGAQHALWDNVVCNVGGASLDNLLTAKRWEDRPLGKTEFKAYSALTVWFATGNNVNIIGDTRSSATRAVASCTYAWARSTRHQRRVRAFVIPSCRRG